MNDPQGTFKNQLYGQTGERGSEYILFKITIITIFQGYKYPQICIIIRLIFLHLFRSYFHEQCHFIKIKSFMHKKILYLELQYQIFFTLQNLHIELIILHLFRSCFHKWVSPQLESQYLPPMEYAALLDSHTVLYTISFLFFFLDLVSKHFFFVNRVNRHM